MKVKMSDKYQVVIPKSARKKMGLPRGVYMTIKRVTPTEITYSIPNKQEKTADLVKKYAGTLQGVWHEQGMTSAEWLRKERDNWDEK